MKDEQRYYGKRVLKNRLVHILFSLIAWQGVFILAFLLFDLVKRGARYINLDFFQFLNQGLIFHHEGKEKPIVLRHFPWMSRKPLIGHVDDLIQNVQEFFGLEPLFHQTVKGSE